jgi:hypothetical protein
VNWNFKEYLQSIRPSKNGSLCILCIVLSLPLLVDIILLTIPSADLNFTLTRFLISNIPAGLLALATWLLVYFILSESYYSFKAFLNANGQRDEPDS